MRLLFLTLAALILVGNRATACTSAIVAAQRSSEGVPIIWKHRDNTFDNTRVEYITGNKYAYTAIVPNNKNYKRGVYAGINEKGLAVLTTATGHLPTATPEEYKACKRQRKVGLSRLALCECATVDEFEVILRKSKRIRGFDSNLGIADATGAVAYFEIWDLGYRRYDAADRPGGFDVRANFSHMGNPKKKGASKRRYDLIMKEMGEHKGNFTPQQLIDYSRSYNSLKYGNVLASKERYICANHTVPRYSTVGAFVMVCDAKNPRMLVMNGHSVSSLAVPVYVKAKYEIPQCVNGNAMRLLSNDFRKKAYCEIGDKIRILNKEVVSKVLKIKQPKIAMPSEMPKDIRKFNADIDKKFAKHEKRVRKVLAKF